MEGLVKMSRPSVPIRGPLRQWMAARTRVKAARAQLSRLIGLVRLPGVPAARGFLPAATTAAAATEPASPTPSPAVPTHWEEHMAALRPGERRALRRYIPLVSAVAALEPAMAALSDADLAALTPAFKARLAAGEPLFALLPEAFAAVREAASRVLGLRPYDVQILGGVVLAEGQVAEMATGEGKTLVASLPAYLYALTGRGVHVVTVNDYLAARDAAWVGKVLRFMGLSVGVVTGGSSDAQRRQGFAADVTYVTAYELAFSFLFDNLAPSAASAALRRPLHYAVVDEVDSILIDEARNPFIVTFPDPEKDAERAWKAAVEVAYYLDGPSEAEVAQEAGKEAAADPAVATENDTLGARFDFLPDFRTRIATLTQRGMTRAVRELGSPGLDQLVLAVGGGEEAAGGWRRRRSPEEEQEQLYVALLSSTENGRVEVVVRPAGGAMPTGLGAAAETEAASIDTAAGERRLVVDSRADVDEALQSIGLYPLKWEEVSDAQWAAAAPAALWAGGDRSWGRFLNQAVRAVHMYVRDIHYIVRNGEIVIIDTATGRERSRSRWQAGLHQALEAKEHMYDPSVRVRPEDYDRGRTTYQALFNLYYKLAGMTGTAATEAEEFHEAYGMAVVRVPPHRPSRRTDNAAVVMVGRAGWEGRVRDAVASAAAARRPVLLGTSSVEESEIVADLVARIPFEAALSELDARRLGAAAAALPPALPPPDLPPGTAVKDLPLEAQEALWRYQGIMEDFEEAAMVARRVAASRRLSRELGDAAERAGPLLRSVASSGLLESEEAAAAAEAASVLGQTVDRSRLGALATINLLNARPDRARKEAEIIAQAGLPGTITVATAMAGRGTDILLGGNPKGLTSLALSWFLLPVLAPNAPDAAEFAPPAPPLAGLDAGAAFVSDADAALHLPPALWAALQRARTAAREARHWAASPPEERARAGPGPALPGLDAAGGAASAAAALSALLEAVEVDRSVFLLSIRRAGLTPSLESALEWAETATDAHAADVPPAERPLRAFALLLWLWFDGVCERYAAQVRAAGGLATIITSIQDTRRTERQLRGRAGRQGDPGETWMISHRDDPAIATILSPAQTQGLWATLEADGGGDAEVGAGVAAMALRTLTAAAEQAGLAAREQTRRYDAAIDSYRRHVFRLRRTLAGGGDAARGALTHRQLRRLAADLVSAHVDATQNPRLWRISDLLRAVAALFGTGSAGDNEEGMQQAAAAAGLGPFQIATAVVESLPRDIIGDGDRDDGATSPGDLAVELRFAIALSVDSTAELLTEILCSNAPLPDPEILEPPGVGGGGRVAVRRRAALLAARAGEDPTSSTYTHPKLKGAHAPAAARLQLWVGDVLALLYERRRGAVAAAARRRLSLALSPAAAASLASTPLHVASLLRLVERDAALGTLDALWADFLQDAATLQRAAQTRAFSQLDPVDEFRLEAAAVFARLLTDFRRQAAVAALGPVDLRDVQWAAGPGVAGVGGSIAKSMALGDAAWVAEWAAGEPAAAPVTAVEAEPPVAVEPSSTKPAGLNDKETALLGSLLERVLSASPEQLAAAQAELQERRRRKDGSDD